MFLKRLVVYEATYAKQPQVKKELCRLLDDGDVDVDFDEEFLDEWQEMLQDDDFFDMVFDNLSLSR